MVAPQQRRQNINQYKSHTVKKSTYQLPPEREPGMMGAVNQAAKIAGALGAVSPKLKAAQKYTHYGSFAMASGLGGMLVGKTIESGSVKSLFKLNLWGAIGGLIVLSFLTRGYE